MDVGHLLSRAALRHPSRGAWIQDDRTISFAEADDRVNRLANALVDLGGRPGDRVGMLLPNCFQGFETILAPMKARMSVVPMNSKLQAHEHEYLLNHSGAIALVYAVEFREHVAALRESLKTVNHFICVGGEAHGDIGYEELLETGSAEPPNAEVEPDDLAWLFYTSGTTGQPKGAMLTHRNLLTMADMYLMDINPVRPDDVLLHAAPITHGSGLCMFHHIARGAASAFPSARNFDPALIFEAIDRYRATTMFLAPTMINLIVSSPARDRFDLSSLHTIIYGGGPMYTDHLLEAIDAFGDVFVQIFGQGEAPMAISALPRSEHRSDAGLATRRRLTSAGREVSGVKVRVVDGEDAELLVGETGEIVVRGDLVMKGYWNDPAATEDALRGGWLHTGDMGHMDTDGYIYITDRIKDLIISGGANVYPREVEETLAKHPSVADVAVIGVPDEKWGEGVKALVVLNDRTSASAEELIDFCRRNLASYKKPQSVDFLDSLPKNAYGKVLKRELRAPFWENRERKV